MVIKAEKLTALAERMSALGILESDLQERFIAGGGRGGQKVNKTASCVHLTHLPSGLEVKCQKTRSREDNRFFARRLLCERLEEQTLGKKSPAALKAEKIRKQKKRRKRRTKSDEAIDTQKKDVRTDA